MIKVLVVDDSALIRQVITKILSSDPKIEVVGAAADPYAAWELMKSTRPDVLTLDVEMPKMDGLTFLEKLMQAHPMPVVMLSTLTEQGANTTLRALELGAVDFVTKPKVDVRDGTASLSGEILEKVKIAAISRIRRRDPVAKKRQPQAARENRKSGKAMIKSTHQVIAIGSSTGGTEALSAVLPKLPADAPGVVIVQHMPATFTKSFAARLDQLCEIAVKEAEDDDRILPGQALLAPGDFHMEVRRSGANYYVKLHQLPAVNRFRPSVDVLFHSCAENLGANAVGVILTGMGHDGADGMLAMREAGAHTIAQDEETCVVFGMPREAIARKGVAEILPLEEIGPAVVRAASDAVVTA